MDFKPTAEAEGVASGASHLHAFIALVLDNVFTVWESAPAHFGVLFGKAFRKEELVFAKVGAFKDFFPN